MNICNIPWILGNFYFRTTLKIAPCVDVRVFLSVAWVGKPAVAVVKLALERLLTWNVEVLFKFQFKFIYLLIRKIKIGFFISNLQVSASTLSNALQLNPSFYCGNRKKKTKTWILWNDTQTTDATKDNSIWNHISRAECSTYICIFVYLYYIVPSARDN